MAKANTIEKKKKSSNNISGKNNKKSSPTKIDVPKSKKILNWVGLFLFVAFAFISSVIVFGGIWVSSTYDQTTFEQMIFNIIMPLDGVDMDLVSAAISEIGTPTVIIVVASFAVYIPFVVISNRGEKRSRRTANIIKVICWILVFVLFVSGLLYANKKFGLFSFVKGTVSSSKFIEDNYVDPKEVNIVFPEEKKNLIYIFLESTETTFMGKENGGAFNRDVIPEITKMALDKENVSFSNTDKLGGAVSMAGATWTMGSMFAQSSGLPLKLPTDYNNKMSISDTFLSYTTCLGDILKEEGYNQSIIMGSNGAFGGRTNYYTIHGENRIYDLGTADDDGIISKGYVRNYWGMYDKELYTYAKKVLSDLSKSDEPFALTMLTVDTHFSDGYPCPLCCNFKKNADGEYILDKNGRYTIGSYVYNNDRYSNVYSCASKQIAEFVEWLKAQDFYEDTAIIIAGDHITMDADYAKNVGEDYIRAPINIFINSFAKASETKNRLFSTMDMFPTTLAAMDVEIEGDKLGLGTNLFSGEKTLIEEYGLEYFEAEITKKSSFYNKMLFAK